jgi:hypothetical protein
VQVKQVQPCGLECQVVDFEQKKAQRAVLLRLFLDAVAED